MLPRSCGQQQRKGRKRRGRKKIEEQVNDPGNNGQVEKAEEKGKSYLLF